MVRSNVRYPAPREDWAQLIAAPRTAPKRCGGSAIAATQSGIKLGRYLFLRHGGKINLIAQFLPVLRSIAGIPAGANRMPWPHFMLANIIGACFWAPIGCRVFVRSAGRTVGWVDGVRVRVATLSLLSVAARELWSTYQNPFCKMD